MGDSGFQKGPFSPSRNRNTRPKNSNQPIQSRLGHPSSRANRSLEATAASYDTYVVHRKLLQVSARPSPSLRKILAVSSNAKSREHSHDGKRDNL